MEEKDSFGTWQVHPHPRPLDHEPHPPHPAPWTLDPTTHPLNPEPWTLNPNPRSLNPKPHTQASLGTVPMITKLQGRAETIRSERYRPPCDTELAVFDDSLQLILCLLRARVDSVSSQLIVSECTYEASVNRLITLSPDMSLEPKYPHQESGAGARRAQADGALGARARDG